MDSKFRPIKTLKVTCKECGHVGNLEVDEKMVNTTAVNYVAKIRHSEREKLESELSALKERDAILLDKIEIIKEEYLIEKDHLSAARKVVSAASALRVAKYGFGIPLTDSIDRARESFDKIMDALNPLEEALSAYDRAMGGEE